MSDEQREFHLEEFKQLKSEISSLLARVETLFKYGLIGSAAVYTWFLTQFGLADSGLSSEVLLLGFLIPPVLVFFFGLLALSTYSHVSRMGKYLKKIERELGAEHLGWEQYWRRTKPILLGLLCSFYLLLLLAEVWLAVWVNSQLHVISLPWI
ncbi:hypothetical protein ACQKP5_18600 [Pseudomonas vancouverensis]|uniref:hypothetical protein n=1 Tax=Pseudomonas vancouverensis TaxID=95300 RepID=UPI003D02F3BB